MDRIRGIRVKLCRRGGQEVTHSSELANPHGSSWVTLVQKCHFPSVSSSFLPVNLGHQK